MKVYCVGVSNPLLLYNKNNAASKKNIIVYKTIYKCSQKYDGRKDERDHLTRYAMLYVHVKLFFFVPLSFIFVRRLFFNWESICTAALDAIRNWYVLYIKIHVTTLWKSAHHCSKYFMNEAKQQQQKAFKKQDRAYLHTFYIRVLVYQNFLWAEIVFSFSIRLVVSTENGVYCLRHIHLKL